MVTVSQLISAFRRESAYDLDVACANPDTGATDSEVISLLNQAQDDLGEYFRGRGFQVPVNITSSSPVTASSIESTASVRFASFDSVRIGGMDYPVLPASFRTGYESAAAFANMGALQVIYSSYPVAVGVTGTTLPRTLIVGGNCDLDDSFARLHLPRFAVAIGVLANVTEGHQMERVRAFMADARESARRLGNMSTKRVLSGGVPRYRA